MTLIPVVMKEEQHSKYLGQRIPVTPGDQYTLSFFYRNDILDDGNGCRIWCNWESADGKLDDPASLPVLHPSSYLNSSSWTEFSLDITAPPDAVAFYLEVRTYPKCITYWDNFTFEKNVPTYRIDEDAAKIKLYPNPASNYLTISNIQDIQHIDIQSLTGSLIWSSDLNGEQTITVPVTGFKTGLYIIRMQTKERIITKRFVRRGE